MKKISSVMTALGLTTAIAALAQPLAPRAVSAADEIPPGASVELLWPKGAPGAVGQAETDKPSLVIFPAPKANANGAAVLVCPGGAYGMLAIYKEGYEVAAWLNTLGVTAFVLKYRLGPVYHHPIEMGDGQRAMRWIRANAKRFHIDPRRVGMMGFSAGGHLTATVSTHFDLGKADAPDSIDRQSCRPDFQVLIYPVITMQPSFTHLASRNNLIGRNANREVADFLSNEKHVTAQTPPAFLVHAKTDPIVPYANSEAYYAACKKSGINVQFEQYERGTHAFGLANDPGDPQAYGELSTWPARCANWMAALGVFKISR